MTYGQQLLAILSMGIFTFILVIVLQNLSEIGENLLTNVPKGYIL